jgi:uncharacterized protein (DUF305 family)
MFNNPFIKTILNYLSYLSLFVGTGFISGSIVHSGNPSEISKYLVIGFVGIVLFASGSLIQEIITGKHQLDTKSTLKFFILSLVLAVGIGMISGGTQHFTDFPVYSSFLIPLGILISWVAFLLKNNYILSKNILGITLIILLLCTSLNWGLNLYANNLLTQDCSKILSSFSIKVQASGTHQMNNCNELPGNLTSQTKNNTNHDSMLMQNSPKITDNQSFIEYVIPHHQDAVDGSIEVLKSTGDQDLKVFLSNVIVTQSKEIELLKGYYKTWFEKEYIDNNSYTSMIKFNGLSDADIDQEYVKTMLGHHSGIIDIAKMVLTDSKYQFKPEIISLSKQIIKDQEADNIILNKWLYDKGVLNSGTLAESHDDGHEH